MHTIMCKKTPPKTLCVNEPGINITSCSEKRLLCRFVSQELYIFAISSSFREENRERLDFLENMCYNFKEKSQKGRKMRSIYLSTSEGRIRDTICVQNSVEDELDLDGGLKTGYDLMKFPTTANIFKYEIERRTGSLSTNVTASEERMTIRCYAKDSPELREKVNRLQKIVESTFDISIFTLGKWTEKKCFVNEIIISSEFDEISWETTAAHIYYVDVDIKFNYVTNFRDAEEEITYGQLISRNSEIYMYSEVVNSSDKYASVEFSIDLENYRDEFGMIISPILLIDNNVITNGRENVKSIHVDLKTGTVRHDGKITDYAVFAPDEKRFIGPGEKFRVDIDGHYAGNLVEAPFTKIITKEKKELM